MLKIGESENLSQSPTEIHTTAKALTTELAQDIRFVFGKAASGDAGSRRRSILRLGASLVLRCGVEGRRERASCQRAQQRAYDRLKPQIDLVKAQSVRDGFEEAESVLLAGADPGRYRLGGD